MRIFLIAALALLSLLSSAYAQPQQPNWITINGTRCVLGQSCSPTGTAASITVGSTAIIGGSTGRILRNVGNILQELATVGSGSVVLNTSPTLVTPNLGVPTALTLTNATGLPPDGLTTKTILINGTSCDIGSSCSPAGSSGITGLSGDITATGPGDVPATLATVNSNVGTYQGLTVNAKGLVTAAGAGRVDLGTAILTQTGPTNDAVIGTALNKLVKQGSGGTSTIINAADTLPPFIGICVGTCGTFGEPTLAINGTVNCVFDGSTTAGNYVVPSTTTNGACHDAGSSVPAGKVVIGIVESSNVGVGAYAVNLNNVGVMSAAAAIATPGGSSGQIQYNNSSVFAGGDLSGDCATSGSLVVTCPNMVKTNQNQTFTRSQRPSVATLALSGSTATPNFDTGQSFALTLVHASCPCTFANPSTTPVPGQTGAIWFTQSASGGDSVTWGSQYKFAGGTPPTLSVSANAVDVFSYVVISATQIVVSAGVKDAR